MTHLIDEPTRPDPPVDPITPEARAAVACLARFADEHDDPAARAAVETVIGVLDDVDQLQQLLGEADQLVAAAEAEADRLRAEATQVARPASTPADGGGASEPRWADTGEMVTRILESAAAEAAALVEAAEAVAMKIRSDLQTEAERSRVRAEREVAEVRRISAQARDQLSEACLALDRVGTSEPDATDRPVDQHQPAPEPGVPAVTDGQPEPGADPLTDTQPLTDIRPEPGAQPRTFGLPLTDGG
jgi:cell division septum initiation protein DivIVA